MNREEKLEKFGAGPWVDEDDHVEFKAHGLPCLLHRNSMGAWCGYAAVPPGHPWHGKKYSDRVPCANRGELPIVSPIAALCEAFKEDDGTVSLDCLVQVHGGITYSEACQGEICHKAAEGEPDNVWWFGFDCSHSGDLTPAMTKYGYTYHDVYRDQAFARSQAEKLAKQLVEAAS